MIAFSWKILLLFLFHAPQAISSNTIYTCEHDAHLQVVFQILCYLKTHHGQGLFYKHQSQLAAQDYSDVDWASSPDDHQLIFKKQIVVVRSSATAKYHAMTNTGCELLWFQQFLDEWVLPALNHYWFSTIIMLQSTLHPTPVFHECTKHIEVDCPFIRHHIFVGHILTSYLQSEDQIVDLFTKAISRSPLDNDLSKLSLIDIFIPTWERVLCIWCIFHNLRIL